MPHVNIGTKERTASSRRSMLKRAARTGSRRLPEHVTPEVLGYSADDPNCLSHPEMMEIWDKWLSSAWDNAHKYHRLSGYRGEPEDFAAAAAWGFWEGMLRFRKDNASGAKPSSYAMWWLLRRVREHAFYVAANGFHVSADHRPGRPTPKAPPCNAFTDYEKTDDKYRLQPEYHEKDRGLRKDERDSFWKAIQGALTRREYIVVRLVVRHGRTHAEVGKVLGFKRATIQKEYSNALDKLRNTVGDKLADFLPDRVQTGRRHATGRVDNGKEDHTPGLDG